MADFFDKPERFAALLDELERWRGTPFRKGQCRPGRGADCVRWIESALVTTGAITPVKFPRYVTRGGGERMLEVFLATLDAIPEFILLWRRPSMQPSPLPKRGQVLVVSSGSALHHLVLVTEPPTVWHCYHVVGEGNYYDGVIVKHLHSVYSIREQ